MINKKELLNNISRGLLLIVVVFFVSLTILLIAPKLIKGYGEMIVQSGSMEPTLKIGSLIIIKEEKEYQVGDIITFSKFITDTPITHRIIETNDNNGEITYRTKGDSNNAPDREEVSFADIRGRVIVNLPYIGFIIDTIKKPFVFISLMGLPFVAIIFGEIKKISKELKRKK